MQRDSSKVTEINFNSVKAANKNKNKNKFHRNKRRRLHKKRIMERSRGRAKVNTNTRTAESNEKYPATESNRYLWKQMHSQLVTWQYKHQIAYWKSQAEAMKYENDILHRIIENFYQKSALEDNSPASSQSEEDSSSEASEGEGDGELSEEMMQFMQKSLEHKMMRERRKREEGEDSAQDCVLPPNVSKNDKRSAEMRLLYGAGCSLVTGLETCVQLNYDNFTSNCRPVYWPNIPLNLNP